MQKNVRNYVALVRQFIKIMREICGILREQLIWGKKRGGCAILQKFFICFFVRNKQSKN